MNKRIKQYFLTLILVFSLSACNLQLVESQETSDLALTVTAQAQLLEQMGQTATPLTPVEQIVVTATLDPSVSTVEETVAPASVVQVTVPTGAVTVTVSVATNCRTGPGQAYPSIYGQPVGQVSEVVGKNTSTNYWIIKIPNSNGTCWLWGQYATVTGDTSSLQNVAIPATPTSTITPTLSATSTITATLALPPAAPSNLSEQNTCIFTGIDMFEITGTLSWTDNSNNEVGFNIYTLNLQNPNSKDVLRTSVGPNTTSYNFYFESIDSPSAPALKVEAFNNTGVSNRVSVNIVLNCPPKP